MAENRPTGLPRFHSTRDLIEFFETHDMGEYWDHLPEAHFEVDLKRRRRLVAIDEDLMNKLSEIATARHVSVEVLIDSWLREKASGKSH